MMREGIRLIISWLRRAVTQPFEELNRWQRAARFGYDLGRYGAHQLQEDRAPQMAAALAFRTLFGLAPVLVVGMILVKSIKGSDAILRSLNELFVAAGLDKIHVVAASQVAAESDGSAITLAQWLENLAGQLANMNLSAIGWVGLAVIVYAAIGLMVTIENSFNIICRASSGRPWIRRVPLYWFLLTVSPALLGLASYVNNQFTDWIASVDTWHWLLFTARALWSFGLMWLFMFAVYTLVPNSTVSLRPAMVGALVAAVLLTVGKHTLGAYLGSAFAINQLYGSLGLVPLFMFWVYLMWVGVLFGLQVSATLQLLRGRSLDEVDHRHARTGMIDPASILAVTEVIAEHFVAGQPVTSGQVADVTSIPEPTIARIIERLVHGGWLHRVRDRETAVSLAKPPEQIMANELIAIGFRMVDEGGQESCSAFVQQLRDAQQTVADGISLAAIVAANS
ncbi:MAG: YihY family inner membrane protein [Planctomycetes bacterium]|nr:YihY family inner membrane protein [Planctomycetota bacterium]